MKEFLKLRLNLNIVIWHWYQHALQLKKKVKWKYFINIVRYTYLEYILRIDFKFGILNLKIFMIIMILCKHCGSHNVPTNWLCLPVVNIGLKMVL